MLIYKLNEAKDAILMNEKGFPIVIDDEKNNEEFGLDGAHLYSKVPELTNKISQLNKSLEINENNLDLIKGAGADLENLTDWTKKVKTALELQDNIDSQKLVEAGKIDEIKPGLHDKHFVFCIVKLINGLVLIQPLNLIHPVLYLNSIKVGGRFKSIWIINFILAKRKQKDHKTENRDMFENANIFHGD